MWRSDDWDEIKSKLPHDEHYQDYDFEAGADALLKKLREGCAIEYIDGNYIKLFGSDEWIEWHRKGLIIFIPAEKE